MVLYAWIALCLLVSFPLARRPSVLVITILAVWIAIPSVGGVDVLGSPVHPAAWLTFAATLVVIARDGKLVLEVIARNPLIFTILAVVNVFSILLTQFGPGAGATFSYLVTYGAGSLLFLLVRVGWIMNPQSSRNIALGVVWLSVISSGLALIQFWTGDVIFWGVSRLQFYWFNPERFRPVGTLDSPLDLALLLVIALPLCAQIHRAFWRFAAAAAIIGGILATQSRSAVIFALLGAAYLVLKSDMRTGARIMSITTTIAAGIFILLVPNPLTVAVQNRFEASAESSQARSKALDIFVQALSQAGGGFGSSSWFRDMGLTATSLENGYLMFAFDFGVPLTLLLVLFLGGCAVAGWKRGNSAGTVTSAIFAAVFVAGYSGIGTRSAAAVLLFTAVALATSPKRGEEAPPVEEPVRQQEKGRRAGVSRSPVVRLR